MIFYNNRYRGPHEYDKFLLNILSLHNMVQSLETYEVKGATDEIATLKSIEDEVNMLYNKYTGKNGICEKAFLLSLKEGTCVTL